MAKDQRELNVICVDCPRNCKQYATAYIEYCPRTKSDPKIKSKQPQHKK